MCGLLFSKQTEPPSSFLQHRSIFMVPTKGHTCKKGCSTNGQTVNIRVPLRKYWFCALMFWSSKHWWPKILSFFFLFRLECPSTRTLSTKPPNYILISSKCSTNWQLEKRGHVEWHIVLLLLNRDTGRIALIKVNDCPISWSTTQ